MATPIWQDYVVEVSSSTPINYNIKVDGTTIYNGKAYPRPSDNVVCIKMNDVCKDYLSQEWIPSGSSLAPNTLYAESKIRRKFDLYNTTTGVKIDDVSFFLDYSFDVTLLTGTWERNVPIEQICHPLVPIPYTNMSNASQSVSVSKNGTGTNSVTLASNGTAFVKTTASVAEGDIVTINGKNFRVTGECIRYALYYVNDRGGWDVLLMRGKATHAESYTRSNISLQVDNGQQTTRETKEYAQSIKRTLTLHTGWLNDAQAELMPQVISSPLVYLYDTTTSIATPVNIVNTDFSFESERTSHQPSEYAIVVEEAHILTRRA